MVAFGDSSPDQVCVGNPFVEGRAVAVQFTLHGQVFVPSVNHLDKVAIFAGSGSDLTAKVKLKITKAWPSTTTNASYEKTVVLNKTAWWAEADFHDAPVTPGVAYLLTVEPLNNAMINWYIKDSPDCNPAGYAFVGGSIERDKDFYFSIRGESLPPQELEEVQGSGDDQSGDDQTVGPSQGTVTPHATDSSDQSTTNQGESKTVSPANFISEKETANSNKITHSSQNISDEEMGDILKMIADDYAKNHKTGMFGLGGVVGRILTPTFFYTVVSLILLVVVLGIIFAVRHRRKN